MRRRKPQTAFTVRGPDGWLSIWAMRGTAQDVRREVEKVWNIGAGTNGWREAKSNGYRVVKVKLTQVSR